MDQQNTNNSQPQVVIARSPKSVGLSLILTIVFGPLGMLYANVVHGIIMIILAFIIGIITFGFGALITWPVSIIWGFIDVKSYNRKLMAGKV